VNEPSLPPRSRATHLSRKLLLALVALAALGVTAQPPRSTNPEIQDPPTVERPDRPPVTRTDPSEPFQVDGVILGPAARVAPDGPLFALAPIARRLGGTFAPRGASATLTLGEVKVVVGAGNQVVLLNREIVRLSQAPQMSSAADDEDGGGSGELLVPLDFLRRTFGEVLDYEFSWNRSSNLLVAEKRRPRDLPVSVDVVHISGETTVVLQVPQRFAYRVVERAGDLEIVAERDRFRRAGGSLRVDDPLVENVLVLSDRVILSLAPDTAADGYVLEDPFRLVFDITRRPEGPDPLDAQEVEPREPAEDRPGIRTIVLDPGHGGGESGAVSTGGLVEKDLTLEIARKLRSRLLQRMPVRVVLTRDDDSLLPLETRSAMANQNKADLFVSIHLNSVRGPSAHGAETYFLSLEASDQRAASSAEEENATSRAAAPPPTRPDDDPLYDLELILWDLAQNHHLAESQRVAKIIQEELNDALKLRDRGVKQAPFKVLMGAAMPAVLVELGFISNPDEEAKLSDPSYQDQLVEALTQAISRYRDQVDERERAAAEAAIAADDDDDASPGREPRP
jgi:N-acetylmuramoyl-L-alanine amidase